MTIRRSGAWTVLSISLLFTAACASDGGYSSSSSSGDSGSVASGAVEDTLQACMNRIPGDATEGQRMLAEKSCARDQANRK